MSEELVISSIKTDNNIIFEKPFDVNISLKDMLSLEVIRKNLGVYANDYSEDEIIAIRRDIYCLVNLACKYHYKNNLILNKS